VRPTALVGPGCPNQPDDVAVVQLLLNLAAPVAAHPLRIDGKFTHATIFAIETFQREKVRLARPDGLIELDSLTTRTLETAATASIQRRSRLPAAQAGDTLSDSNYQRAAAALSCEVAAVKAVSQVESAGSGFLPSKQSKILFEAHVFSKATHHKYDLLFPDISSRHWNRALYRGGVVSRLMWKLAMAPLPDAALGFV
jgi:N-acetylmuramidase-like protein